MARKGSPSDTRNWRRLKDVEQWRLVIGLLIAPLPILLLSMVSKEAVLRPPVPALTSAIGWFAIVESTYIGIAYRKNVVARSGFLIFGGIAGATWPLLLAVMSTTLPIDVLAFLQITPRDGIWDVIKYWPTIEVLLVHFGTFAYGAVAGWILWRLAIRPAPEPADINEIFD